MFFGLWELISLDAIDVPLSYLEILKYLIRFRDRIMNQHTIFF
jgi:hypothetical protein